MVKQVVAPLLGFIGGFNVFDHPFLGGVMIVVALVLCFAK